MNSSSEFLDNFLLQINTMAKAFPDPRPCAKVADIAIGLLCGQIPKTITSALHWMDRQHQDWSDCYRLFSQSQWSLNDFFHPVLTSALEYYPHPYEPIYTAQDDTLVHKTGKKIPGTAYARDPLSPPFQVNLVMGQRFLQTSILVKVPGQPGPWRSIPISFQHAPPLKPPPRATSEQKTVFKKEARKKHTLSLAALSELHQLRNDLDQIPNGKQRLIIHAVDGSFANRTFLPNLPQRTVVVARIRKNAKLRAFLPPHQRQGPRKYGPELPTPEHYLKDPSIPWQSLPVFVAGQVRTVQYQDISPLCWPKVTGTKPLRLIIIKAAGYRLRKGSKLLYREPAFLICTEICLLLEHIIKAYLARWEVEVNFRDEKTGLGVGQAQVWNPTSVARAPAFLVACYAALLLTSLKTFNDQRDQHAFNPLPKWRRDEPLRPSLRDLIALLRKEAAHHAARLKAA
jgi:hypothetical protein